MTPAEAMAFVRTHGVVLESSAGPAPSLATAIVGASIDGGERRWKEVKGNDEAAGASTSHQREQIGGVAAAQTEDLSGSQTHFEIAFE